MPSFNEAAAIQLRMLVSPHQMRFSAMRFNEAAAIQLRMLRQPSRERSPSICFNEAAAIQLRMPVRADASLSDLQSLQ